MISRTAQAEHWLRITASVLVMMIVVSMLASCRGAIDMTTSPVGPPTEPTSTATFTEAAAWAGDQADAAIASMALEGQFGRTVNHDRRWDTDRAEILAIPSLNDCGTHGDTISRRYILSLTSDPLDPDPGPIALAVRDLWASKEWAISYIGSEEYVRADRLDGSFMTVRSITGEQGVRVHLLIASACSPNMLYPFELEATSPTAEPGSTKLRSQ